MERHGVVVYVLAFSVDGRPRFAAVIRHFAVVYWQYKHGQIDVGQRIFPDSSEDLCHRLLHLTF